MNFNQLFSADFAYEINSSGTYELSPQTVGIILGTVQDETNYITIEFNIGEAVNCKDYFMNMVYYPIKPAKITITGMVKVLIFEKINN